MTSIAASLNLGCHCVTLDREALRAAIERSRSGHAVYELLRERPQLFAGVPVFVDRPHVERIAAVIDAVEALAARPEYVAEVLRVSPGTAARDFGPRGVFFGYDFHLTPDGPRLVEVNTNAGGGLLNALAARAQVACCDEVRDAFLGPEAPEDDFFAMFLEEWRLQRGDAPLRTVAIVDDDPEAQFLYPEFALFRDLFAAHGVEARVAAPGALVARGGALWLDDMPVDLVYNRLCDFSFAKTPSAQLRSAWERGEVVVTPHPRAHALYADKRRLITMSDPERLAALGLPEPHARVLVESVPRTVAVEGASEDLWAERRDWFFKPATGFGSRAAYRGDKLTRTKWAEIVAAGDYVAQRLVPPSLRTVLVDGREVALKLDVRAYAYAGRIQLLAARLYQGQTTNLRTEGGGFAAVFVPAQSALMRSTGTGS